MLKLKHMKCPACSKDLVEIKLPSTTVQACDGGCAGLWFDHFGLQKVEFSSAKEGETLLAVKKDPTLNIDTNKKKSCPKCHMLMMQHFFSVKKQVTVDECPKCAGYWLDGGELAIIRSEFTSESERQAATEKYFNTTFAVGLDALHEKDKGALERAAKIQNALGIISTTNYKRK